MPTMLLPDRAYDADWIRAVAAEKRSAHTCTALLVERFFNKIKHCRRVATGYDKLATRKNSLRNIDFFMS